MIFRILEDQFAQKFGDAKAADLRFMQLALTLGRRGLGRTWPNPAVGALVIRDGVIISPRHSLAPARRRGAQRSM
jgi:diaminohydroxyphosphoribosylaminopyrimidine deaminase / 5-amino-6-(5-phosphoribosylamino)uracil reductase